MAETKPTKLTPARQKAICKAIAAGNTREVAARSNGISPQCFWGWLARGKQARTGIYHDFAQAVEKADAEAVTQAVGTIRTAMRTTWQAAAWWLERRYPDEWGRRDRVTVERLISDEAQKIADELGLDAGEIIADVERIIASRS